MALRRLNILNIRSIVGCGIRWCSRDVSAPEDVIIASIEPEVPLAEISSIPLKKDENRLLKEIKNNESFLFTQAVPQKSETVAAFVSKSELLQNLVKLGVDLSEVEKDPDMAEYLIKADFKLDIQPYILFLYDCKILPEDMGKMFTKHPSIFKESLDNLQLRIDYFKSKSFSEASIVRIVTKQPSVLTRSTLITDKQLGFIQKTFHLQGEKMISVHNKSVNMFTRFYWSGDEVREVVTKFPKLIVWEQDAIRVIFNFWECLFGISSYFQWRSFWDILFSFRCSCHPVNHHLDHKSTLSCISYIIIFAFICFKVLLLNMWDVNPFWLSLDILLSILLDLKIFA